MIKDKVVGIVVKNSDQVLLVKRRDVPVWEFAGGKIEKGESPESAIVREIEEESGFLVNIIRKIGRYTLMSRNNRVIHVFECQIDSGGSAFSQETKDVKFFKLNSLPQPRHPYVDIWLNDKKVKKDSLVEKRIKPVKTKDVLKKVFKYPIPVFRYLLYRFGIPIKT